MYIYTMIINIPEHLGISFFVNSKEFKKTMTSLH